MTVRTVFRGPVFRVNIERVRLPNGRTVTLDVVRHRGSVVLLAQPTPRTIVLIRQYRPVIRRWLWELPAGSIDAREQPSHAARRECAEEIGLAPGKLRRLATFYPTPGFIDERMIYFLCTDLRKPGGPVERDEDELIQPKTFTIAEARAMVRRGKIVDMKTIVGLELLKLRTKN